MAVNYISTLGTHKRIADIVFAGSHDASITSGKWNAKTQSKSIGEQAASGVRIFDLRILARTVGSGASMVGFHGSKGLKSSKTLTSDHTGNTTKIKRTRFMALGTFGLKLSDMLTQAAEFVAQEGEFLIFKFDKCSNYQSIAEYCVRLLGDTIYAPTDITQEFGKVTLGDLQGKVVCIFNDSVLGEIDGLGAGQGILGFRNLKSSEGGPKAYKANYPGLQYFGKGGTNAKAFWRTNNMKINENLEKQKKLMLQMAANEDSHSSDVLGMMYWTSTGSMSSIKSRNKKMWGDTNVKRMQDLWAGGLEQSVSTQFGLNEMKAMEYGESRRMKAFFPNIVMVDFANDAKCETIFDLNNVADDRLIRAYDRAVNEQGRTFE